MGLGCRWCKNKFPLLAPHPFLQNALRELCNNIPDQLELTSRLPNSNHSLLSLKMHQSDATFHLTHDIYLHKQ